MRHDRYAANASRSDRRAEEAAHRFGADVRNYVHAQLATAQSQLARSGDDRHEGVHQARKCLRRARAALALGDKSWKQTTKTSDVALRRICRGLSIVRDAQALLESLNRLEGDPEFTPELSERALAAATQRRNDVMKQSLQRDPDFAARRRRIATVGARLDSLDWIALDLRAARAALARSERRLRRAQKRARKKPENAAAWHTFRRRLRRFRQQVALVDAIAPAIAEDFDRREDQAAMLGELQDDSVLLARCGRRSPFARECRVSLRRIARRRLARRLTAAD